MSDFLATRYQPSEIEAKWYAFWEGSGFFAPKGEGDAFSIMIPPPNVTGTLHMGHAFQDTIMDILVRFHRMQGEKTLWQVGSDHAGIATQMVVERRLNKQGKTRHDLGREAFVREVWDWKAHSGGEIMRQLRRLGASVDWSRERFTMDEQMSRAVRTLFVRWYDEGLIYRGKRLVNWDPVLKTAISDLEVESREEQGEMFHVRYPLAPNQGLDGVFLEVATTRPETILADTAVAVHPEDTRFAHLVGKRVVVPLVGREVPIVADEYVERDFGTGCVKITPAHDFNDYQVGKRHDLPMINMLNLDATLNENVPECYQGLDRFVARARVVEDLKAAGLLLKVEPHQLKRPYGDRSGVVIEPLLTDQWFVDLTDKGHERLTVPALDAVREGRIRFVPKNWENTYFHWLENIEDWCISRQLWWGHRIPAWYDDLGNVYVAENEALVREKYGLSSDLILHQDEDVLDTWFSSGLWCFATQGWPDKTQDLSVFYPSSVMVTGFDIIFFWVARMILMGLYCMDGEVPFKEVYIHGLVRDGEGRKMSKSKGNVIDPIDVIDGIDLEALVAKRTDSMMQPKLAESIRKQTMREFPEGIPACGTDALRFSFAALATMGRDVVFDIQRVEGYRNFCNKLWNAARFVLMQTKDKTIAPKLALSEAADVWIFERLNRMIHNVRQAFADYRFDFAAQAIYEFVWGDYCDWYLELVKPVLSDKNDDEAQKANTRRVLLQVLELTLRTIHPIMPYISEEIWQQVAPLLAIEGESIMTMPYPEAKEISESEASAEILWLQGLLLGVRKIRAERDIAPKKPLNIAFYQAGDRERLYLERLAGSIKHLGRVDKVEFLDAPLKDGVGFVLEGVQVFVPLSGLIDKEAELARIDKALLKLEKNITRLRAQLENKRFVESAPAQLVENTRKQLAEQEAQQAQQLEQRAKMSAL